ncbi:hypothetical protein IG631_13002 [Alternaria alternata]|nr:hypothetical protein IG631_13002 [Alternaria alternata]
MNDCFSVNGSPRHIWWRQLLGHFNCARTSLITAVRSSEHGFRGKCMGLPLTIERLAHTCNETKAFEISTCITIVMDPLSDRTVPAF